MADAPPSYNPDFATTQSKGEIIYVDENGDKTATPINAPEIEAQYASSSGDKQLLYIQDNGAVVNMTAMHGYKYGCQPPAPSASSIPLTTNQVPQQQQPQAQPQQIVIQQPTVQQPVVYVDQNGNPIDPSKIQVVVMQLQPQQPQPQQQQPQQQYAGVQLQVGTNNNQTAVTASAPQDRTITNLDELPPDYQSIIDGTYDQQINPKKGLGYIEGCRQSGHMKSWILAIGTFSVTILFVILISQFGLFAMAAIAPMIICWCCYTLEWTCCASTSKYLSNIHDKGFVYEDMARLQKCIPTILWKVECYHYRHYTDSKGNRKRKKVVTHRAQMNYVFRTVRDVSAEFKGLEEWELTKLTTYKTFSFGNPQTNNDYNLKSEQFRRNNDRDRYQNFTVVMNLQDFKPKILVEAIPGARSQCLSKDYYCLLSFMLCSPCYRTWFSSKTGKKHYIIQKEISI